MEISNIFDYKDFTLEEIDTYKYYDFICDGDNKTITTETNVNIDDMEEE